MIVSVDSVSSMTRTVSYPTYIIDKYVNESCWYEPVVASEQSINIVKFCPDQSLLLNLNTDGFGVVERKISYGSKEVRGGFTIV